MPFVAFVRSIWAKHLSKKVRTMIVVEIQQLIREAIEGEPHIVEAIGQFFKDVV